MDYNYNLKKLKGRGHRWINKIVARQGKYPKKVKRNNLYEWLDRNLIKGHFADMKTVDEIEYAIKKLKEYYKNIKKINRAKK